jgi:hypothetical protein
MTESQHLLPCVFRARPDIDLTLFRTTSFTRCGLTLMFLHRGATALWALYSLLMPDISQIQASQVSASLGVQCIEAVRCYPTLQVVRMCFISLDSTCSDLRHALHSRNTHTPRSSRASSCVADRTDAWLYLYVLGKPYARSDPITHHPTTPLCAQPRLAYMHGMRPSSLCLLSVVLSRCYVSKGGILLLQFLAEVQSCVMMSLDAYAEVR